MQKSYLAQITFDDESVDADGRPIDLTWPDGSKFDLSWLDSPLNEDNRLVQEFLFRGVGNKYGIGLKVLSETETLATP